MIIDCHVHANNYGEPRRTLDENVQLLREQMAKWSLDHCLLLSSYVVNENRPGMADLASRLKGDPRIHLVEGVWATGPKPVEWDQVEARLKARTTVGLKLYPGYDHAVPSDERLRPALELAERYRVPVMVHTGDTFHPKAKLKFAHPLHVDEVAVDWPDVDFIVCHLGNPWLTDTAELIYKNENVYADISGLVLEEFTAPLEVHMREQLEEFFVYSGEPDKLLFGTDWPLVRMGPYLRFVEQIDLEPELREMLMWENAARLFRIDVGREPKAHALHGAQHRPNAARGIETKPGATKPAGRSPL